MKARTTPPFPLSPRNTRSPSKVKGLPVIRGIPRPLRSEGCSVDVPAGAARTRSSAGHVRPRYGRRGFGPATISMPYLANASGVSIVGGVNPFGGSVRWVVGAASSVTAASRLAGV